jgi:DNA-binding transcriptional regulator YdaS (Cro superfamily)
MNQIKRAAEIVGSQRDLANYLGVTPGAVSQWSTAGVPVERCIDIEKATNGAVRCEDLRPDVDWAYLRATDCDKTCHQEAA